MDAHPHKHYAKGEYIYLQEDESDKIFFLTEGRVKIGAIDADSGREITKAILSKGEVFGELGLPLDDVPRPPRRPSGAATRPAQPAPTAAQVAGVIDALQRGADLPPIVPLTRAPSRAVVAPCAGCHLARPGFAFAA